MDTYRARIRTRLEEIKARGRPVITKIIESRNKKREESSVFKSKFGKSEDKELSTKKTKSKSAACLTACKPCCSDCPPNAIPFAASKFGSISGPFAYLDVPATAAIFDSRMPFFRGLFYSTLIGIPKQNQSIVYEGSDNEISFIVTGEPTMTIYVYTIFRAYIKLISCDSEKLKALVSMYNNFIILMGVVEFPFPFELGAVGVFQQLLAASSKLAGNPPSLLDTLQQYDVYNCKYDVCVKSC